MHIVVHVIFVLVGGVVAVHKVDRNAACTKSAKDGVCVMRHKRVPLRSAPAHHNMMRMHNSAGKVANKDVLGCWGKTNDTRLLKGGTLDLEETRNMLETSFARAVWNKKTQTSESTSDALAMKIPRCPRLDATALIENPVSRTLLSEDASSVNAYLDTQLSGLDKAEPPIVASMENFELPDRISDTADGGKESLASRKGRAEFFLNFLCGMQRLGLDRRLVIFALDSLTNQSLVELGGSYRVLHHHGLFRAAERAAQSTRILYNNRLAKLVLPLLLQERGFPVILTDVDTYWVRDPTPYLLNLGVDFAAQSDMCANTLNSGFLYYSASPKSIQMLQLALSAKRFENETHRVDTDNDQYLLNCAHAHALVHEGLRSTILPRPLFTFGTPEEGFMNFNCKAQASNAIPENMLADHTLPYLWHTSGTSCQECVSKLTQVFKTVGFWDVKPTSAASSAKQGYCLDGPRGTSQLSQTRAKHAGQDSCRTAWHPWCRCSEDAFQQM
jgi:hypothetical protein